MKHETYKVILLFPVRGQTTQYGSLAPKPLCLFFSPTGSSDNRERWMLKLLRDVIETGHLQRTEEADGSGWKLLHQWFRVMVSFKGHAPMRKVLFIGGEIPKQEARKVRKTVFLGFEFRPTLRFWTSTSQSPRIFQNWRWGVWGWSRTMHGAHKHVFSTIVPGAKEGTDGVECVIWEGQL